VYYLQQNVALLAQISNQISSVVPQVTIPSTPPPSFPTFNPSASDIRVNVFWFMALIFSLKAALLATLVQQWVRDYMHVFQRYGDPLKSARIRQYLYEGSDGWYMPIVAEAVPGVLHISVLLFSVGLVDFVLKINTTVGLTTAAPIGICGLFYTFTIFAPVIYPQSPYQNSFSGLIWYLFQTLRGREYKDRDGESKSVNPNMAQGQMQLAMEETVDRIRRDADAIRWLVENMTEDSEMELLAMTIPGSFNTEWGTIVWKKASEIIEDGSKNTVGDEHAAGQPADTDSPTALPIIRRSSQTNIVRSVFGSITRPVRTCIAGGSSTSTILPFQTPDAPTASPSIVASAPGDTLVGELSIRISHLLESCKNRSLFPSDELWRRRTRACVGTAASLVLCANAELGWFGDIGKLLRDIGRAEMTRESSLAGMDQSFVTRWTCLSIVVTRSMLDGNLPMQQEMEKAISRLESIALESSGTDSEPQSTAQTIDMILSAQWQNLFMIFRELFPSAHADLSEERVEEVIRGHPTAMSSLEQNYLDGRRLKLLDGYISFPQRSIQVATHELICEIPGVEFDGDHPDAFPFSLAVDLLSNPGLLFVLPGRCFEGFCSIYPGLQDILEGQDPQKFQETLKDMRSIELLGFTLWEKEIVQRQLWRLEDLRSGGGLGFCVEIFLIALKHLLSASLSKESQSALYTSTFQAITSDWRKYKHSLGTQKILLHIISSRCGLISRFNYPAYITDKLLVLVDNVLNGQTGPHIDLATERLRELDPRLYQGPPDFPTRALEVISQSRPFASSSS